MSIDLKSMPKLGFGLMRLPEKDGVIDHEHVCRMVDSYMQASDVDRIFNEQCEGVCPQHLPIIELLKDAAAILDV